MKTNAQQIESIATLAQPKPFDVIQTTHFLAREIIGFNNASDKLVELQKSIDDTKTEKGTRKKAIDMLLREMWQHGVTMIEGAGVTKCHIRIELRRVLDETTLAKGTKDNIISAVAFAVNNKKPYDIKARDKHNAAIKAAKMQEKLKADILKDATTPTNKPPTTTPTPPTTTPTNKPPTTTTPTNKRKNTRLDYCKDASAIVRQLFDATQFRKCLNDYDKPYYDDIIASINDIMETLVLLAKDRDDIIHVDDDNFDADYDDLQIDSELVD